MTISRDCISVRGINNDKKYINNVMMINVFRQKFQFKISAIFWMSRRALSRRGFYVEKLCRRFKKTSF